MFWLSMACFRELKWLCLTCLSREGYCFRCDLVVNTLNLVVNTCDLVVSTCNQPIWAKFTSACSE
jgi:hypothetical protein